MRRDPRSGFGLIEVIIGIGLIVMLFGGIYLIYYSVLDITTNSEVRAAATAVLNREIEVVRNMPYDQVGTVGGVPSGVLSQTKTVTSTTGAVFELGTVIRNIDDPFDGTLGGTPNDTSPADYKLVDITLSCLTCAHFSPLELTARVAPKNLESAGQNGSLFITVLDAGTGGVVKPVPDAVVHVTNSSTVPVIDLTDLTDQNGILQLVGTPTSTHAYHITVTKAGYTTAQNYPSTSENPNPKPPYATVDEQTLTQTTFRIDGASTLAVQTSDARCTAVPGQPFAIQGTNLIGQSPDILKFSTSSTTSASGTAVFSNMEWDTYSLTYTGTQDQVGTLPRSPMWLAASSTETFQFILAPADPKSLLITVKDADSGVPVASSTVRLTKSGYDATHTTGRSTVTDTDWSGGGYAAADGVSATAPVGSITMFATDGRYSTTTTAWLVSNTIDLGSSSSSPTSFAWNGAAPSQAGPQSVRFQIAANNDNVTWSFVGSGGDAGSYFTAPTSSLAGLFGNVRYVRYKVFLTTADETVTPFVDDATIEFGGPCVPSGQVLFAGLASGTYAVDVLAPGYGEATSTVSVTQNQQQMEVNVAP